MSNNYWESSNARFLLWKQADPGSSPGSQTRSASVQSGLNTDHFNFMDSRDICRNTYKLLKSELPANLGLTVSLENESEFLVVDVSSGSGEIIVDRLFHGKFNKSKVQTEQELIGFVKTISYFLNQRLYQLGLLASQV